MFMLFFWQKNCTLYLSGTWSTGPPLPAPLEDLELVLDTPTGMPILVGGERTDGSNNDALYLFDGNQWIPLDARLNTGRNGMAVMAV